LERAVIQALRTSITTPATMYRRNAGQLMNDPTNSLLRYAPRPELLSDTIWQGGLALLRGRHVRCEIEIFGSNSRSLHVRESHRSAPNDLAVKRTIFAQCKSMHCGRILK
jgi:hypothetical protein